MSKEEQIRASIENIDSEILKDTLAILLSQNIESQQTQQTSISNNYSNFAQAIINLKKNYKFPELNFFTTEADLVYVQAGDRRVLLTDKNTPTVPSERITTSANEHESEDIKDNIDNAFENIKPNDNRFSHLEL